MMRRALDRPGFVFAASFLCLLVLNLDRVADPPYWDALTGVYTQGVWLKRHRFDYFQLASLPGFYQGGPNINIFYAMAPVFGLLSRFLAPPGVFFLLHLFNYACAAVTIAAAFSILRARLPLAPAALWVLAAAASPIWIGQTAAIYNDIPLAACAAVSLYFLWGGRHIWAGVFCFLGFFFKESAILLGLAYALAAGLFCSGRAGKGRFLALLWPLASLLLLEGLHGGGAFAHQEWTLEKLKAFFLAAPLLYPPLPLALLLEVLLFARWLIRGGWRKDDRFFICGLAFFVNGFWLAFVFFSNPAVRYTVLIQFPLACLTGLLLAGERKASIVLASAFIAWGAANSDGALLRPLPEGLNRSGHFLERSREYLKDLDGNRRTCAFLEKNFFAAPILAKAPFTQMLTVPEFGYVSRALPGVVAMDRTISVLPAAPFWTVKGFPKGAAPLRVYSPNINENSWRPSLKPRKGDRMFYMEESLPGTVMVFSRRR